MSESTECFIISPIGGEGSELREHADNVFNHVIKEPLEDCGYQPVRADQLDAPGDITRQVIERVYESPLAIADLTFQNANVFYELAIRHAARKPVLQIMQSGEDLPFDVQNTRTIFYDLSDVPRNEEAKRQIKDQIQHIEDTNDIKNPISETLKFKSLSESDDPEQQSLGELRKDVSDMQSTLMSLENFIRNEVRPQKRELSSVNENELRKLQNDHRRLIDVSAQLADVIQQEEYQDERLLQAVYADLNGLLESMSNSIDMLKQHKVDDFSPAQ